MSTRTHGEILACRAKEQTADPDACPIGVHVTHFATGDALRLELLLQDSLAQIGAIIRGGVIPEGQYVGRELDHSRDAAGRCKPGALPREAIWTMGLQVAAFENAQRRQRVALFVGNGNLWANDGFVAWVGRRDRQGREAARFGLLAPPEFDLRGQYSSLVVWRDGRPTVETVSCHSGTRAADGFQRDASFEAAGGNADDVLWAISGQHVVQDGRPNARAELVESASAGGYYDLNHVVRFLWLSIADPKVFVQVGYRSLLDRAPGRVRVSAKSVRAALSGAPIEVDIGAEVWREQCGFPSAEEFDRALLEALRAAGYEEVPNAGSVGEYTIADHRVLRICFFPGYYPHSLVGVSRRGRVVLIQVTRPKGGVMIGNRSAMTVLGTARAAVAAANRSLAPCDDALADALLVDNGGDVMLWQREPNGGWAHTVESELHRDALRSMIAIVTDADTPLPHPGIRHELFTDVAELLGAGWEPLAKGSVLVG